MKIFIYNARDTERDHFDRINRDFGHEIDYTDSSLSAQSVPIAKGFEAVCATVTDVLDRACMRALSEHGIRMLALRCIGTTHVDLDAAEEFGVAVVHVPAYSANAVAEHTIALMLTLNRKIHRAYARVRDGNFSLQGLEGFDMSGKVVGVVGTGRIGSIVARILTGFGCHVLAYDPHPNPMCRMLGVDYIEFDGVCRQSDIITFHCPLTDDSRHLVDRKALDRMKANVMLINTGCGEVLDTPAVVEALKEERIGSLGMDVYEEESDVFYRNLAESVLKDDVLARLLTFPNVILTGHQGFYTRESVDQIAAVTLDNLTKVAGGEPCDNQVNPATAHNP